MDGTNENAKYPFHNVKGMCNTPFQNVEARGGPCNRPGQGWWLTPHRGPVAGVRVGARGAQRVAVKAAVRARDSPQRHAAVPRGMWFASARCRQ